MAANHRDILNNDPDLLKLLAYNGDSNRLDEYDDEFVDRITQKMNRINVVNPTGFSRRTAWTLLSQLITALAKKQAAAVNECYEETIELHHLCNVTVSALEARKRNVNKKTTTREANNAVQTGQTIEEMQANVSLWDVPLSFSPTETIPMNDNISEIDRITLRESPEREPIDEMANGFSDDELDLDDGNETINFGASYPLDFFNDTGIQADISNELSNVPLISTDNDNDDSAIVNIEESSGTEPPSTLEETDADNSARPPKNRKVPQKRKPVHDFKKVISSATMKNRISTPLVGCSPYNILPNIHHKSAGELFRTTAHHGSINKKMFDALKLKPVQNAEPEWDCLNELLGPNAMEQIMNGDNDGRTNRTLNRRSNNYAIGDNDERSSVGSSNMSRFDSIRSSTPVADDNILADTFGDADDAFLDDSTSSDASRENNQSSNIATSSNMAMAIFDTKSTESKIMAKLQVLWANNIRSLSMHDLVEPGSSRFAAAKMFYTLMDLKKKSIIILETNAALKITDIRPGDKFVN